MFHLKRMRPLIFPFIFLTIVYLAYSQQTGSPNAAALEKKYKQANAVYSRANNLFNKVGDDSLGVVQSNILYRQALHQFADIIPALIQSGLDSLATQAALYSGLIYHNLDSIKPALQHYLLAIQLKEKNTLLADSLLFQPCIFAGSIYYKRGNIDSALYFFQKAEKIKSAYANYLEDEPRLYNVLGIISYETGNLRQSINYINKALTLMRQTHNNDPLLVANYQLNLASAYIRLEEYKDAKILLASITPLNIYKDEINQKLGYIAIKEKNYRAALDYYNKVIYPSGKKMIDVCINKSTIYRLTKQYDSATYHIAKAKTELLRDNAICSNAQKALLFQAEAELLKDKNNHRLALSLYQQSIIHFSNNFSDTSILSNPKQFSGAFLYIDLFNALNHKAELLDSIYTSTKNIQYLEAALHSYESAYQLSAYIEKTYNADEARIFLNKIKYNHHHRPIAVSLRLFELTKKNAYLEAAFFFDQSNKASSLTLGMAANDLITTSPFTDSLLQRIRSIKSSITRIAIANSSNIDTLALKKANITLNEKEIELDKLQEDLKKQPEWKFRVEKGKIPSVGEIQKKINPKSAIISYHLSPKEIVAFVVNRNKIYHHKILIDSIFFNALELYKQNLHNSTVGKRFAGGPIGNYLFNVLVLPIQNKLAQTEHLVIIPDDELHYLPFESLQDGNQRYVVEKFSIQYLYSTSFFNTEKKYNNKNGILSIAPFTRIGYNSTHNNFPKLAASYEEIKALKGLTLIDTAATKSRFLKEINHYPVVHLATHAFVDNENAQNSYVAFSSKDSASKLYSSEISNLQLDSTELVILSACETGVGKLIKGEGLMSLSRAFAYAGCRNIITSLWRAEDVSTSFILQRLHYYLAKGYSKPRALQEAKLDFLKNNEISPVFKSPNYWAHIVFIGNYEEEQSSTNWVWVALAIVVFGLLNLFVFIKKNSQR
jgi:CHAT domain-containing protein